MHGERGLLWALDLVSGLVLGLDVVVVVTGFGPRLSLWDESLVLLDLGPDRDRDGGMERDGSQDGEGGWVWAAFRSGVSSSILIGVVLLVVSVFRLVFGLMFVLVLAHGFGLSSSQKASNERRPWTASSVMVSS